MDLADIRTQLDTIDTQILQLFMKRQELAPIIAAIKSKENKPTCDPVREQQKLNALCAATPPEQHTAVQELFTCIMKLSRTEQDRCRAAGDKEHV